MTKPINSLSVTSGVATLTVVANDPGIVSGYSNAVMSEPTLKAYFPVDGSTGTNLANVKDSSYNGNIYNMPFAFRNGNTNLAAGNQALSFNTPNQGYAGGFGLNTNQYGYVEIPGDSRFDFTQTGGNGTIEAVLSLEPSALNVLSTELVCWFSSCSVPGTSDYYQFLANYDGYIFYQNQATGTGGQLVWSVPGGLVGKRTHIAIVFQGTNNVTCYANGVSLGTKRQVGFGNTPPGATPSGAVGPQPLTIGMRGGNNNGGGGEPGDNTGYMRNVWRGSVDDLAIYGSALSGNTIASHAFILNNGTTPAKPGIAKISPSKSLYTGFPVQILSVTPSGSPPFTYQWRSNNVVLAGATNTTLNITGLKVGSYNYTVVIGNSLDSITSAPVVLTVIDPSGYAARVFASSGGGPKAFYPLNETSGTTIFDWAGTHDGVISGAYKLGEPGPVAGDLAVKMWGTNGAGADFSQIVVPFYPELNSYRPELDPDGTYPLTAYDGRFTYEFWYRPDSSNAACALSSQYNVGNNRAGAAIYLGYTGNDGENQTTFQYWTMRLGRFNNTNQGTNQNGRGGPTPPPIGQWCHVCLVADGMQSLCVLYMNGIIEDTDGAGYSTDPNQGFVWNANPLAPLVMGNRNRGALGSLPMNGALSQVAIYDYPLTYDDITNHTAKIWTPATFTQQPAGKTNVESFTATITLTAKVTGVPNDYVWVKDGVELAPVSNFDGSDHYPVVSTVAGDLQGPFSTTLLINQLKPSDSGQYWLKVINPMNSETGGSTNSAVATVLITNDTIVPIVADVGPRGTMVSGAVIDDITFGIPVGTPSPAPLFLVEARFSKRMDPLTATNPANYTISGGVLVTNVVIADSRFDTKFGADYRTVGLVTTGLTPGANYTLTIRNLQDQAQTPNPPAGNPFTAPTLRGGTALWSYYYRIF